MAIIKNEDQIGDYLRSKLAKLEGVSFCLLQSYSGHGNTQAKQAAHQPNVKNRRGT